MPKNADTTLSWDNHQGKQGENEISTNKTFSTYKYLKNKIFII